MISGIYTKLQDNKIDQLIEFSRKTLYIIKLLMKIEWNQWNEKKQPKNGLKWCMFRETYLQVTDGFYFYCIFYFFSFSYINFLVSALQIFSFGHL